MSLLEFVGLEYLLGDKDQNSLRASKTQGYLPTDFFCSSLVL